MGASSLSTTMARRCDIRRRLRPSGAGRPCRGRVSAIKAAGARLGVSTHSDSRTGHSALRSRRTSRSDPFTRPLKVMQWAPQGLERISEWKRRVGSLPLVAIGGITPERADGVAAAGADSIAVITDFLTHPDPKTGSGNGSHGRQNVAKLEFSCLRDGASLLTRHDSIVTYRPARLEMLRKTPAGSVEPDRCGSVVECNDLIDSSRTKPSPPVQVASRSSRSTLPKPGLQAGRTLPPPYTMRGAV